MKRDQLKGRKSSLFLPNLSLRHRIPILICLLLTSVITIFGFISYYSLKKLEIKEGRLRLFSLASQANSMIQEAFNEIITITEKAIPEGTIQRYLQGKLPEKKDSILMLLQELGSAGPSVCAEIRDRNFQLLLNGGESPGSVPANYQLPPDTNLPPGTTQLGKIYHIGDSIYYAIIIPITETQQILGYLIRYRRIRIESVLIQHFSELAGGATLYMGNKDGSLWTDLQRPASFTIPVERLEFGKAFEYTHDNVDYVSTAQHIPNTPWITVLEIPWQIFSQSSNEIFNWLVIIGVFLIAIGIVAAWLMSSHLTQPLNELTKAIETVAEGNYLPNVDVHGNDEVGKLERSFNVMSKRLNLAQQVSAQQIVEAKQLNQQLRQLSAHLEKIREEERMDIAREMHDELGQLLTGFKMEVYLLKKKLAGIENGEVKEKIAFLENTASEAIEFVRKLSSELRLGPLEDLGLIAALEWYCTEFSKRYQIPVFFKSSVTNLQAPALIKTGLFRIYQESLTNIARHAKATQVQVDLRITNNHLSLVIKDNGTGFVVNTPGKRKTLGLMGMKERAIMIGGELNIIAAEGGGTTIEVMVPVTEEIQYT